MKPVKGKTASKQKPAEKKVVVKAAKAKPAFAPVKSPPPEPAAPDELIADLKPIYVRVSAGGRVVVQHRVDKTSTGSLAFIEPGSKEVRRIELMAALGGLSADGARALVVSKSKGLIEVGFPAGDQRVLHAEPKGYSACYLDGDLMAMAGEKTLILLRRAGTGAATRLDAADVAGTQLYALPGDIVVVRSLSDKKYTVMAARGDKWQQLGVVKSPYIQAYVADGRLFVHADEGVEELVGLA